MEKRKHLTGIFSFFCLMILVLDGKTAFQGAAAGVELCAKTVIPSLFPFLFFCSLLTESLWGCHFPGMSVLGIHLGIPKGAESLLIPGFLGGYPAGAQAIGEAYRQQRLSKETAQHLLRFCSNAGPAFLFGITALQFSKTVTIWQLWAIQIAAALLTGLLHRSDAEVSTFSDHENSTLSQTLSRSLRAMGQICGWILLFRVLTEFLNRWFLWRFPAEIRVLIIGLLELSNGCCQLQTISNPQIRFFLCTGILSFGGICVAMQTASVIGGLSLGRYLLGKVTQTAIGLLLAWCTVSGSFWLILLSVLLFFIVRRKKVVAIRQSRVYNADINSGGHPHAIS